VFASQAKGREFESRHPLQDLASKRSQLFTKEIFNKFLDSRASGTSPKTIKVFHAALDNFIDHEITPEGINAYLNSLTCGNGRHNYYRCIKTLCRWLYHTDQLPNNPIEKVLPPKRQKKILPAINKEQLNTLLGHCLSERDKVILNLLWYSGMRLSEAANVKASDFNWDEGTVIILGKGNRFRKALAGNGVVREWFLQHQSPFLFAIISSDT
jgi:site-specific recombinase XerD